MRIFLSSKFAGKFRQLTEPKSSKPEVPYETGEWDVEKSLEVGDEEKLSANRESRNESEERKIERDGFESREIMRGEPANSRLVSSLDEKRTILK